jgi:type IV secretory pathway component VirB8
VKKQESLAQAATQTLLPEKQPQRWHARRSYDNESNKILIMWCVYTFLFVFSLFNIFFLL